MIQEARRQKIVERQLVGRGYSVEEVQRAVAAGDDAVAALCARPPTSSVDSAASLASQSTAASTEASVPIDLNWLKSLAAPAIPEATAQAAPPVRQSPVVDLSWLASLAAPATSTTSTDTSEVVEASLIAMGFERAAVLDAMQQVARSGADLEVDAVLPLLLQEGTGTVFTGSDIRVASGSASAESQNLAPVASPTFDVNRVQEESPCVLCAAACQSGNGMVCLQSEPHSICTSCFHSYLSERKEQAAQARLRCPVPGCTSEPWPLAKLAQQLPEGAFQDIIELRERLQKDAMRARDPLALPSYWSGDTSGRRWKAVALRHSTAEWKSLASAVALTPGSGLGGRDMRLQGAHSGFRLKAAWRIENSSLFNKYSLEKQRLRSMRSVWQQARTRCPSVRVRSEWFNALKTLPGELDQSINELYLSHGTKPDIVQSVMSGGLNERFSGGIFGHGTYFAEDLGKNDQYVTADASYGQHQDLHKELYEHVRHPGQVFYVFLCRVMLGHFCVTKDGTTTESGANLWSSAQRELAYIPGTVPPEPFHALLAETGGRIQRYREFITFHGDRIYPEYLVAYQRV